VKLTVRQLRRLIREFGVDTENRLSAGLFMAGGVSNQHRDRESTLMNPPPGLGAPEEEETEESEKDVEKKSQFAVRVSDRHGGEVGSSRIKRPR
jgi:hypothetical protein